jgi:hypothetical protein
MKQKKISLLLIVLFFFISCNKTQLKREQKQTQSSMDIKNFDFEHFKSKFKPLKIEELSNQWSFLNDYLIATENTNSEVDKNFKSNYLKSIDTSYVYYGYKIELLNNITLLSFINHSGTNTSSNETLVIDTTFVTSIIFDSIGNQLGSFRLFGTNLTGEPPTYNMTSKFEYKRDEIRIYNYEYSTGKNYNEVVKNNSDSLLTADLTITSFTLDYKTGRITDYERVKQKTKVIEVYSESSPVYLKEFN